MKAAVQRTIAFLPQPQKWNQLFQEHVTRSTHVDMARFEDHLRLDARHMDRFREFAPSLSPDGFTAFELGTGMHPILPLALYLCGAREVWTYDIDPLLNMSRTQQTFDMLVECHEGGDLGKLLPQARDDRMAHLRSIASGSWDDPQQMLGQFGIRVVVGDAAESGLPASSVDSILSNSVFQYISSEPLSAILREFRRISTAEAVMSHDVHMWDQYSHIDQSITPFNFLRFSSRVWRVINNPLIPLNRLRVSDYRQLLTSAGFEILEEVVELGDRSDLGRVLLAPEFLGYSENDLLTVAAWFVARPHGI